MSLFFNFLCFLSSLVCVFSLQFLGFFSSLSCSFFLLFLVSLFLKFSSLTCLFSPAVFSLFSFNDPFFSSLSFMSPFSQAFSFSLPFYDSSLACPSSLHFCLFSLVAFVVLPNFPLHCVSFLSVLRLLSLACPFALHLSSPLSQPASFPSVLHLLPGRRPSPPPYGAGNPRR